MIIYLCEYCKIKVQDKKTIIKHNKTKKHKKHSLIKLSNEFNKYVINDISKIIYEYINVVDFSMMVKLNIKLLDFTKYEKKEKLLIKYCRSCDIQIYDNVCLCGYY